MYIFVALKFDHVPVIFNSFTQVVIFLMDLGAGTIKIVGLKMWTMLSVLCMEQGFYDLVLNNTLVFIASLRS